MNNEVKVAEKIKSQYTEKEITRVDELKELDKKVKRPAGIFAYTFGTAGSLVLGTGMSLAMGVIGTGLMIPGIAVGAAGIAMVSTNHLLHKKILAARKKKYAGKIIELSDGILNA